MLRSISNVIPWLFIQCHSQVRIVFFLILICIGYSLCRLTCLTDDNLGTAIKHLCVSMRMSSLIRLPAWLKTQGHVFDFILT